MVTGGSVFLVILIEEVLYWMVTAAGLDSMTLSRELVMMMVTVGNAVWSLLNG